MKRYNTGGSAANDEGQSKQRRQVKAARLIVRNLPFSSTEEKVHDHFSQFGKIEEVKLLRNGNKLVGCGFVQFESKANAAAAITKASGQAFLGRTIIVDWAVPKDSYKQRLLKNNDIKEENCDVSLKEEPLSDSENEVQIKEETESVIDSDEDAKSNESNSENDSDDSGDKSDGNDSSSEDEEDDDDEIGDEDEDKKPKIKKRKVNDILEGRTVFIKNVPFMATEEELENAVKRFGPIFYAKICMDPVSEHSKGTAFVKFKSKKSADDCLAAGTDFVLNLSVLDPHPALPKGEIKKKQNEPKKLSDSRNLYLLKEGVVMPGSKSAEGVSAGDMAKRLQIEKWKRQIIKDLCKFVSRTRLVIHNLPPYYDDKKVSLLIKKYSPKFAKFREVKVMRDLKNIEISGLGRSKGFAFVSFDKHEDALSTLRTLNNNPSIFKSHRRPIVSFSVESRKALKAKERRLEKSRQPKQIETKEVVCKIENEGIKTENGKRKKKTKESKSEVVENKKTHNSVENESYLGSFATPGSKKFMNNFSTKRQALLHRKQLKKEKSKAKVTNRKLPRSMRKEIRKENMTRPKNPNKEDKDFTKLVDKYKAQFKNINSKKWFD